MSVWPALPAVFEATFLHSGRSIHHTLVDGTVTWFDTELPDERFTHPCAVTELSPGVWLIDFSKVVEGRKRRTFLAIDGRAGHTLDATFLEEGPHHWRFDRGTIDGPLGVEVPLAFPRRDPPDSSAGAQRRAFALTESLTLVAGEERGEPVLSVWDVDASRPRAVHVAPPGL